MSVEFSMIRGLVNQPQHHDTRTYLIIVCEPRCRSDDREVGVAPQRQGRPLIKARNDLIDRQSGNPLNEQEILLLGGTNFVQDVVAPPSCT